MSQPSPILQNSLCGMLFVIAFGIAFAIRVLIVPPAPFCGLLLFLASRRDSLTDANRSSGKRIFLPNSIFNEAFERKMKFVLLIGEHHERGWICGDLGNVFNFDFRGQSTPG